MSPGSICFLQEGRASCAPFCLRASACILDTMNFRRDELAARAQLTVELILTTLAEQRLVPGFVEAYAKAQRRNELLESAIRYRELILILTREALLAISARISTELPRKLFGAKAGPAGRAETVALDGFREDYFFHLARVMRWTPEELEEFYNDHELYQMIAIREAAARPGKARAAAPKRGPRPASPFSDRTALLLDPSFMEKARAAAAAFEPELESTADKIVAAVFRLPRKK